jgi:Ras-related protein Rab-1A
MEYDAVYKLIIVGNSSVGKTSFLTRFIDNLFSESFLPTIGVDYRIKTLELDSRIIKLQLWDTAGQ